MRWYRDGRLSSTVRCFDIGNATSSAQPRFERTGEPFSGSTDPHSAGNGSIMRLSPVPMFSYTDAEQTVHYAAESSRTNHGAPECVDACRLFALLLVKALHGKSKRAIKVASCLPFPSGRRSTSSTISGKPCCAESGRKSTVASSRARSPWATSTIRAATRLSCIPRRLPWFGGCSRHTRSATSTCVSFASLPCHGD